jgi:hypothetical protein
MAATSGENTSFPALPSKAPGEPDKQRDINDLIQHLMPFDIETISGSVRSTESKVSYRRLASKTKVEGVVKPLVAFKENILILPSSVKNSQNHVGHYMLKVGEALGMKIVQTPYTGAIQELSEFSENVGVGIYMSLTDGRSNFNIKTKSDPYEKGRTLVRSQQIMGCLLDLGHKPDILKPNQYYFGNNPGEIKRIDKQSIKVTSFKTDILSIFVESDWAQDMLDILIKLMRRSYTLMPYDTIYNDLKPQLLTYTQVIAKWCSSERIVEPAKGKRKAQTVKKVPGKPKSSPLLLKPEMDLLNSLSSKLFGKTSMEELSFNDWCTLLLSEGMDSIRTTLRSIYNNRQTYLLRFAKLTTQRLTQVRKIPGVYPNTKKASITTEQVAAVVLNREDPVANLTQEILSIDPNGTLFINQYFAGDTENYAISTLGESDMRGLVAKTIIDMGVYNELRKTKDNADPWVIRYLELERAHRITKREYDELRAKIQQSDKKRKVKVNKEITLYDLILDKAKISLPDSSGNKKQKIPHEVKKPQGAGNVPDPRKGKQKAVLDRNQHEIDYQKAKEYLHRIDQEQLETPDPEEVEEAQSHLDEHPAEAALLRRLAREEIETSLQEFLNSPVGMAIYTAMLQEIG